MGGGVCVLLFLAAKGEKFVAIKESFDDRIHSLFDHVVCVRASAFAQSVQIPTVCSL